MSLAGDRGSVELLEREAELEELDLIAARAREHGAVALIEGAPGIGKTSLLAVVVERTRSAGFRVLEARAGELEREIGWSVAHELFSPALRDEADRTRLLRGAAALSRGVLDPEAHGDAEAAAASDGALHGLYWLTSNLAEERPLALAIDDAHWADAPSLRFLAYLAARAVDLRLLLLLAARPAGGESQPYALAQVSVRARVLVLSPLSETSAGRVLAPPLGRDLEAEFARACHSVTGGNPFLLRELGLELAREGVEPTAANAGRVSQVRPGAISRAVLLRLANLPETASGLVRAAAVLGSGATLRDAARVAGIERDEAATAAAALAWAEILSPGLPLRFVHPIVREAIYDEIPGGLRALMHERAARMLADAGAPSGRVAMHLLATEPAGDSRTVELLRAAAQEALARGVPESAAAFLRRAIEEGPGEEPSTLSRELGVAQLRSGDPSAITTLEQAIEQAREGRDRGLASLELSRALASVGRIREAVETLDAAWRPAANADRELGLRLESELLATARLDPSTYRFAEGRLADAPEGVEGRTSAERRLLASLAFHRAWAGEKAAAVGDLAERALAGERLLQEQTSDAPVFYEAIFTLIVSDRFDVAVGALDAALEDARRRGSAFGFFTASAFRCLAGCWAGSVAEAEADGRVAVDAALAYGSPLGIIFAYLIEALLERDELEAAREALEASGVGEEIPENLVFNPLLYDRGRLRLALGETEAGLADLFEVGRRAERLGGERLTSAFPYRSQAAIALAASGEAERARALATEELELARAFGAPRALGIALRAAGMVERGERRLELLREAVSVLEPGSARLEHARALVELGAALRREGQRTEARDRLRNGLDLAHRCGATTIERRAREELVAVGARPRRERLSGPESLTAAERRVAELAAQGYMNREIAQQLFVSLRTVETHLTRAYGKLEIRSRGELANALRG